MGQRANYIIRHQGKLSIYYNHWRANHIAADLYLGEKRFVDFVKSCQPNDELMEEVWIEGAVILNFRSRDLHFWSLGFPSDTSVADYYIDQLSKKWPEWKVHFLQNEMYDVERVLGIDYISKQELPELNFRSDQEIATDLVEEWTTAIVIINDLDGQHVIKTGNLNLEALVSHGSDLLPLLREKPSDALPMEGEEGTEESIFIDTVEKRIIINKSIFGLWEQSSSLWPDYDFKMGNFGYLDLLKIAGIDGSNKAFSQKRVHEDFALLVKMQDNPDPGELAKKIMNEHHDVQFNPDFFDNTRPSKTFLERMTIALQKVFRLR